MSIEHDEGSEGCPDCSGKGYIEWPSYGGMGRDYGYTCDTCDGNGYTEVKMTADSEHKTKET